MDALPILTFEVPGLLDRPAVGTSCCVTSAEALIAQELFMLPGVEDAEIDPRSGRVVVRLDPRQVSREEVEAALTEIGYPPSGLTALAATSQPDQPPEREPGQHV